MTEPDNVPEPPDEYDVPAEENEYEEPAHPGKPPFGYHDAEDRLPPPVSGSID